ncbi:Ku protein [Aquincola sp. S2]|uniref:Non-homologous end joining protein Ku n=1 Tax=Pseudaquabacterium terrae TaxID=2732868 RepID=A0ABX2EHU9_9BURK|nr:Ku protein [Aquabacterium terrae]NRF68208.1 Ku protein [Aquabacterium terrae]
MPRAIWKGAISFGLVHVPVALYPASSESGIDFDWLDKRSLDPVGYKRINKRTGKEIEKDDIVRGVQVEGSGDYVLLSDDEIAAAYPKTMQTIAIERFVRADEVPFVHLEKPYYLEPSGRGADKVYALLREAMLEEKVIGIARVVMHSKEHLAALIPTGPALMLNTLRWVEEIRPWDELSLPPEGRGAAKLKPAELEMAAKLVHDMTGRWKAEEFKDQFAAEIHALVKERQQAGKTHVIEAREEAPETSATVIDLAELLKRSLGERKAPARATKAEARAKTDAPAKKAKVAEKAAAKAPRRAPAARKRA